ncbi:MAG: hypothetical protein KAX49_14400 [Halanaerobiales bacterium]|nr:hypothetical protein [Halanaerobiales bacterium]
MKILENKKILKMFDCIDLTLYHNNSKRNCGAIKFPLFKNFWARTDNDEIFSGDSYVVTPTCFFKDTYGEIIKEIEKLFKETSKYIENPYRKILIIERECCFDKIRKGFSASVGIAIEYKNKNQKETDRKV